MGGDRGLRRLRWFAIVVPATALTIFEYVRHWVIPIDQILPRPLGSLLSGLVVAGSSVVFMVAIFRIVEQMQQRLVQQARALAALEERDRIARELHDSLAQVLGYLAMQAKGARMALTGRDLSRVETALQEMADVADEAYTDVREAILGLREAVSSSRGVFGMLGEYLRRYSRQTGISCQLILPDESVSSFRPELEVQLIRVIQEALTNVRKHARARKVVVTYDRLDGKALITVADDGCGFDPSLARGGEGSQLGLTTMRERLESVGGGLEIYSSIGQGTEMRITVPVEKGEG
ncbi:MAG: sensor histidine kinase [Chloroflexi bacterium]|nr:sensor histidine kinase [Chloroflexota bacterium]